MKRYRYLLSLIVLSLSFVACGNQLPAYSDGTVQESGGGEAIAKESNGTRNNSIRVLTPEASGSEVYSNDDASIDASNSSDGYVMVKYTGSAAKVRMLIETPAGNTYNYLMDLDGKYDVYPLSEGNGTYKIGVYENLQGDQYAVAFTQSVNVTLKDEYSMYLYPNAYVDFTASSAAVKRDRNWRQVLIQTWKWFKMFISTSQRTFLMINRRPIQFRPVISQRQMTHQQQEKEYALTTHH